MGRLEKLKTPPCVVLVVEELPRSVSLAVTVASLIAAPPGVNRSGCSGSGGCSDWGDAELAFRHSPNRAEELLRPVGFQYQPARSQLLAMPLENRASTAANVDVSEQ